jgi:glyoxylase-like metal-dependent hydrolase (beta-lactamase superfamily II)
VTAARRVVTIDCQYVFPKFAAAYLLLEGDRAAFIDNNTAHSVPLLLEALKREGLTPAQVDYVIITHVHLDHAGGTSQLMKACPQARCLAHPRAARHLIDPAKLVKSARAVYGDEPFDRMYGLIEPIPEARVQTMQDDESIAFGASGAPLRFLHTRGHANHHMCIDEPVSSSVFTGDSFGLAYPLLQRNGLFIFPSTSPTDFDYAEAVASLAKILATGARTAYPTHYGAVTDLKAAAQQLRKHLDFSRDLLARRGEVADAELETFFRKELSAHFESTAASCGLKLNAQDRELVKMDLDLNAQGLAFVARKASQPAS